MLNINKDYLIKIGAIVVKVGAGLYLLDRLGAFRQVDVKIEHNTFPKNYNYNYYSVVDTIVNDGGMLTSNKKELIGLIEKDREPEYYKSVANIIKDGGMLTSNKKELIKLLGEPK